jgi:hypothetical protein
MLLRFDAGFKFPTINPVNLQSQGGVLITLSLADHYFDTVTSAFCGILVK